MISSVARSMRGNRREATAGDRRPVGEPGGSASRENAAQANPYIGKTYAESLALIAERHCGREALVFKGRRWSFAEAKGEIDRASARLAHLGVAAGDKVAIWMPNRPEFLWYWLGTAQMGAVAVVINTRLTRDEFVYQLDQSDTAVALVCGETGFRNFVDDLAQVVPGLRGAGAAADPGALPKLRHVVCVDPPGERFPGVVDWSAPPAQDLPPAPLATDPDAPAMIAYSSGTTARPKGAMLTHCVFRKVWDGGERMGTLETDRLYLCVPLFGVLATFNGVLNFWVRGATVVLAERFEAGQCLKDMQVERCSALHVLPAMVDALLEHPGFGSADLSRLRIGIALTQVPAMVDRIANELGVKGVVTSYGLTETTSVATRTWSSEPLERRRASQGRPLPGVEAKIIDEETGGEAPPGTAGEIWLRGYCVMLGYYNKPRETKEAITEDGWLRTGDLGTLDAEGNIHFISRLRDSYKHKGFNVSTTEVEQAFGSHPDVAAAQVVGVPHSRYGEVGAAFVILRRHVAAEALLEHARARLASYKLPEHIFPVESFPVTAGTEKVQKFRLREQALEQLRHIREDIQ